MSNGSKSLLLSISIIIVATFSCASQNIYTIAGNGVGGFSGDGGPATAAEVYYPEGIATDTSGNVYIADYINSSIRKVDASGTITTIAGIHSGGYSGDGGPATNAELYSATGVTTDASGNVYIADLYNDRIRMVNTSGIINTIIGNGVAGYSGDGGPATAAELHDPWSVVLDKAGNIYIADQINNCVRMVNTSGIITTIAGNGVGGYSGDGGPATSAELFEPYGVAVDASGNVYISDFNETVRMVNTSGIITTIVGNGVGGYSGDGGPATAAEIQYPEGIALDTSGNLYIADYMNSRVRMVNTSGIITTIAGNGLPFFSGDGGPATASELNYPSGVTIGPTGNIYVVDQRNQRVRMISGLIANAYSYTNVSCNGASNGSANVIATGGMPGYTYSWSDGNTQITDTATGLSAGTYTVTVTDGMANSVTATVTITEPTALIANINSTSNVSCNGGNDGSIGVTAGGGTSGYTYLWNDGQTGSNATGLTAGMYTVTVTDKNGCTTSVSASITQPAVLTNTATAINTTLCAGGCTDVNVSGSGGTPAYTYSWSTGGTSTSINVCPVTTTVYTCTVTDAYGCTTIDTAIVNVNALPAVNVSVAKDSVCVNWTADTLTGTPTGGTYSGAGVTGNNFNPATAGIGTHLITYTYTDGNGCSNSDTIKVVVASCTGINEITLGNEIKIYPNPFGQSVNITSREPAIFTMFNMMGQNVGTWQMDAGEHTINMQNLSSGVYTMEVKTKEGVINRKLIKME